MPNLGHTMEVGRVQEWLKAVGDPVRAGEAVAIVESDKASFDVESPADVVLLVMHAEAGSLCRWVRRSGLSATHQPPMPQARHPRCAHAWRPLHVRRRKHRALTLNSLPTPAKAAWSRERMCAPLQQRRTQRCRPHLRQLPQEDRKFGSSGLSVGDLRPI